MYPKTLVIDELEPPPSTPVKIWQWKPTEDKTSPPVMAILKRASTSLLKPVAMPVTDTCPPIPYKRPLSAPVPFTIPIRHHQSKILSKATSAPTLTSKSNPNPPASKQEDGGKDKTNNAWSNLTYEQLTWIEIMKPMKLIDEMSYKEIEKTFEQRFGRKIPRDWTLLARRLAEDTGLKRQLVGFRPLSGIGS